MANCNHQYLKRLADVSKHHGHDEYLPDSARMLFAKAFDLADAGKYTFKNDNTLDDAFVLLCSACQAAGLDPCKGNQTGLLSCRLLWDYSS